MATQVQNRRGTTAEHSTFTGANGELTVDTTKRTLVVHDGATAGGRPLLREDQSNLPTSAPTTGIYNVSGSLAISTSSSERIRIGANGEIGLGGANYGTNGQVLTSAGSGAAPTWQTLSVSANSIAQGNTTAEVIDTGSDGRFVVTTEGSERLRVTSAGLVGIGTSIPGGSFDTYSNSTRYVRIHPTSGIADLEVVSPNNSQPVFAVKGTGTADLFRAFANTTQAVTIDSSGRVAIGNTTPGNFNSVANQVVVGSGSGDAGITLSTGTSSSGYLAFCDTGNTVNQGWYGYSHTDNALLLGANGSERARIDSSGRLLVGMSTASTSGTSKLFQMVDPAGGAAIGLGRTSATSIANNLFLGGIEFLGAGLVPSAAIYSYADADQSSTSDLPSRLVFSTTADGASSPTERMRITEAGRLLANMTTTPSAGGVSAQHGFSHSTSFQWSAQIQHTTAAGNTPFGLAIKYTAATPNGTSSDFLFCEDATAIRARIYSNGGLANYSANNANLSDRNAKKDISPAADTWDCIKEWEIVNYRYKDQPDDADLNLGVIAQQVAESCPEVITVFEEAKDDQPEKLGIKEQQMYWMAIKALQEAQVRIEQLEAKVAALESA